MDKVIQAIKLQFAYRQDNFLLQEMNLAVRQGDFLGLIGANGSGKTTMLKLLSGFLRPSSGKVLLKGRDILTLSSRERARSLAVVPQIVTTPLPYTVRQIITMGRTTRLAFFSPLSNKDHGIVEQVIDELDLQGIQNRRFNELSGGERQRIIIAAALAQEPELLLLDEPTAALDLGHKIKLMRTLKNLQARGIAIMVISHDIELMARYCDRLTLLYRGQLLASGTASEVINPDLIKRAYDCDVEVCLKAGNTPQIIPIL